MRDGKGVNCYPSALLHTNSIGRHHHRHLIFRRRRNRQSYDKSPSRTSSDSCTRGDRSEEGDSHRTDPKDVLRQSFRADGCRRTMSGDRSQSDIRSCLLSGRVNRGDLRGSECDVT
ncbi:unnamed protein product [Nippostrongylus brasiliensis]|uniref:Uncharacterized protein n=1 Tax=Nippostrongylus brasiliensis TaxID=27835 RepID=A0A3P7AYD4_NIPBR|nr:unnamed protein product [Nippostrongylus brasiliensis]